MEVSNMLSPRLETERLVLRRYEETDIDMQYEIITDNRLSKYIKFPDLTKEEELEYIKDCIKMLMIQNMKNGCVVYQE